MKPADQFARYEGIGRPAFAVAREIEQLAIAAAVDVEDAFDANGVLRRSRRRCGSLRRHGDGGRVIIIHTKQVFELPKLDREIRRGHF